MFQDPVMGALMGMRLSALATWEWQLLQLHIETQSKLRQGHDLRYPRVCQSPIAQKDQHHANVPQVVHSETVLFVGLFLFGLVETVAIHSWDLFVKKLKHMEQDSPVDPSRQHTEHAPSKGECSQSAGANHGIILVYLNHHGKIAYTFITVDGCTVGWPLCLYAVPMGDQSGINGRREWSGTLGYWW